MTITTIQLENFRKELIEDEMSEATVKRYESVVQSFALWLEDRPICKELLLKWRNSLTKSAATVNVEVAAVNRLLDFLGFGVVKLKHLKSQRSVYRPAEKELTKKEYVRLVKTAERLGKIRLARAIETICVVGLRVSELRYVTVEALMKREITINNKGKIRTVFLNSGLVSKLKNYCKEQGIRSGEVFVTRTGRALTRTQLWTEMKRLCEAASVKAEKVFPHNLRHLFAVTYYRQYKDVVRLADLLGHSSIDTTRIYLKISGEEQRRELEYLGLMLASAGT